MNREVAERLMQQILAACESLNLLTDTIERIEDMPERKRFRRAWAEIAADHYVKLMTPILRQYPELDPDK